MFFCLFVCLFFYQEVVVTRANSEVGKWDTKKEIITPRNSQWSTSP